MVVEEEEEEIPKTEPQEVPAVDNVDVEALLQKQREQLMRKNEEDIRKLKEQFARKMKHAKAVAFIRELMLKENADAPQMYGRLRSPIGNDQNPLFVRLDNMEGH